MSLSADGSVPTLPDIASSRRSSPPIVGRAARRRIRSRQALTTIRCSQVVTAESPRKLPARRKAEIIASCSASAASSGSDRVRTATAHSRSRCRRKSVPKASESPATCCLSSTASDSSAPGGSAPGDSAPGGSIVSARPASDRNESSGSAFGGWIASDWPCRTSRGSGEELPVQAPPGCCDSVASPALIRRRLAADSPPARGRSRRFPTQARPTRSVPRSLAPPRPTEGQTSHRAASRLGG